MICSPRQWGLEQLLNNNKFATTAANAKYNLQLGEALGDLNALNCQHFVLHTDFIPGPGPASSSTQLPGDAWTGGVLRGSSMGAIVGTYGELHGVGEGALWARDTTLLNLLHGAGSERHASAFGASWKLFRALSRANGFDQDGNKVRLGETPAPSHER